MAELDVGMRCIKYMLFLINAMFMLTALLVIFIGNSIQSIYIEFSHFLTNGYISPTSLLIAIGIIMLIVSSFGVFGAIKESTCLVNTFALLLSIVFVLEISAAIAAFCLQNGLRTMLSEKLNYAMHHYTEDNASKLEMDNLQLNLYCCGVEGYEDWKNTTYGTNNEPFYPESCLKNMEEYYTTGCVKGLTEVISQSAFLLGTGALTVAFIQFIGIIFSIMLASAIRQAKTERERRIWEIRERMINGGINYTQMDLHKGRTENVTTNPVIYVPSIGHTQA